MPIEGSNTTPPGKFWTEYGWLKNAPAHQILGLERKSSYDPDEVKAKHRELLQKYSPDRHHGDESASKMFALINDARDQLLSGKVKEPKQETAAGTPTVVIINTARPTQAAPQREAPRTGAQIRESINNMISQIAELERTFDPNVRFTDLEADKKDLISRGGIWGGGLEAVIERLQRVLTGLKQNFPEFDQYDWSLAISSSSGRDIQLKDGEGENPRTTIYINLAQVPFGDTAAKEIKELLQKRESLRKKTEEKKPEGPKTPSNVKVVFNHERIEYEIENLRSNYKFFDRCEWIIEDPKSKIKIEGRGPQSPPIIHMPFGLRGTSALREEIDKANYYDKGKNLLPAYEFWRT